MVTLTATAHCLLAGCDWQAGPGAVAAVDLAARRHTGEARLAGGPTPGHPTGLIATPTTH